METHKRTIEHQTCVSIQMINKSQTNSKKKKKRNEMKKRNKNKDVM